MPRSARSPVWRIVRGWRRLDRQAEARETARQHASRALNVYQDEDGTVVIRGRLEPEAGATLIQALNAARDALYRRAQSGPADVPAETPTMAQQQADALVLVAESTLHHGIEPGAPAERYKVVVHVDSSVLENADSPGQSVMEGGGRVSAETSQRVACDASRVVMEHDADGRVVEVGARTRTIPTALRRALPPHQALGARRPHDALEPRFALPAPPPRAGAAGMMASYASDGRMVASYPTSRHRRRRRATRSRICGSSMRRMGSRLTRERQRRAGSASIWTSAGPSMSCIHSRPGGDTNGGRSGASPRPISRYTLPLSASRSFPRSPRAPTPADASSARASHSHRPRRRPCRG